MRLIGGTIAGTAADKWGRKLPLMLSVLWFSLFAFLSGFAPSYAALFAIRALFGLGMGGEWAAGMPLVLEHWPARLRGLASGLMLGGWYWGYLLAAAAFQFIYPLFSGTPDLAWRVMFWVCIIPALFTLWIRARVPESPVWLERQRRLKETGADALEPKLSLVRIFQKRPDWHDDPNDAGDRIVHVHLLLAELLVPDGTARLPVAQTCCRSSPRSTSARFSARRRGDGSRKDGSGAAAPSRPRSFSDQRRFLSSCTAAAQLTLIIGALTMGFFGMGVWGMAPAYTVERFPTEVRGVGPGFCYHAGSAFGAAMPFILGAAQDRGMSAVNGMSVAMIASAVFAAIAVWSGPETRGRDFNV